MDKRLVFLCTFLTVIMALVSFPDGALSVFIIILLSVPSLWLIRKYSDEKDLLANIFLIGLSVRIILGLVIHIFELRSVFGPDARLYDAIGTRLVDIWNGLRVPNDAITDRALNPGSTGWGMNYLVGSIYYVFGPSILVAQSFCAVFGALTAPIVYFCAEKVFANKKVSYYSALSVALFPSFVIWSSQLLKDGLIIFLLVCVMTAVLHLQKKFDLTALLVLIAATSGILALRFYIFYMVAFSIVGSFVVGLSSSVKLIVRNIIILILVSMTFTYLGIIKNASESFETYGSLERIQISRQDLAKTADTGFGEQVDVTTVSGVITAIPIGLVYLFFAPFPWEASKLNQLLVLPETFLWWALIPIMISGLIFSVKNKLRSCIPILLFSLMITVFYSVFQGNVGMLYRQRTQIQVFLFMFIAVGFVLYKERKENKRLIIQTKNQDIERRLKLNMER